MSVSGHGPAYPTLEDAIRADINEMMDDAGIDRPRLPVADPIGTINDVDGYIDLDDTIERLRGDDLGPIYILTWDPDDDEYEAEQDNEFPHIFGGCVGAGIRKCFNWFGLWE